MLFVPKVALEGPDAIAWLAEACVRYARRSVSLAALGSSPVVYPFDINISLSYVISNTQELELRTDGLGN